MTGASGLSLTLYVRAETSGRADRRQAAAVDRARTLLEAGVVDDLDVVPVVDKVAVAGDGPEDETTLDAFEAFSEWAQHEAVRLHPAFQTRECYSWETGDRYTALIVPVIALAVSDGDELLAVYPHGNDAEASVFDGLRAIERGTVPSSTADEADRLTAE